MIAELGSLPRELGSFVAKLNVSSCFFGILSRRLREEGMSHDQPVDWETKKTRARLEPNSSEFVSPPYELQLRRLREPRTATEFSACNSANISVQFVSQDEDDALFEVIG